jgi:hypothetical protein
VGQHIPKDFPRSPSVLLKKSESPPKPNLTTPEQVAAVFSSLLGSKVDVDPQPAEK